MSRRERRTSSEEHFALLVASDYGMAAMEWSFNSARAQLMQHEDDAAKRRPLLGKAMATLFLREELSEARARARGKA